MLFNSAHFLFFFPIVVVVYYCLPQRIKSLWLLIASYYFYMCWNAKYVLIILFQTLITYIVALLIDKKGIAGKFRKTVLICGIVINLGILGFFKYTNFGVGIFQAILKKVGIELSIPVFDILLPVGISFYTFQAIGYAIDVYRGEICAEKNFLKYALFVSFFPQLVAGPIERSKNLLRQLSENHEFSFERTREGFFLMLWGFFLKIVLADRIAIFVDTVYDNYTEYAGCYLILATVFFAVQIYCDFAGYSTIAVGAAKILGINIMENFDAPYLSCSVADFWRRWHISLTSWFRDYLYIPIGGSRNGFFRTQLNKLIVFLASGLWHGASLSFVIWGGLNGLFQIVGELCMPLRTGITRFFHLNTRSFGHKLFRGLVTFLLVDFSWLFFRAGTAQKAFSIVRQVFSVRNPWVLFDGSIYECGLDMKNYWIMIFGIMLLFFSDVMKRRGIVLRKVIISQDYWFRCFVVVFSILGIMVFGIWGSIYDVSSFIYFQF